LEAIESLQRRSILEKQPAGFTLQPIVRIYVAQQLSEQMAQEMTIKEVESFKNYTLMGSLLNDGSTRDRSDASMTLTTKAELAKRLD
jgi:hypothetical protein